MHLSKKEFITGLVFEAIFALAAYLVTILVSIRLLKLIPEIQSAAKIPFWQIILAFALGTGFILILLRFSKRGIIFHIFFSLALFLGLELIFSVIIPFLPALILAACFIAARYLYPKVWVQNLVLILGLSGLAISLGFNIHWIGVVVLLALLSVYDIIAVYKTRHMVKMAEGLIQRKVFPALIVPHEVAYLNTQIKEVKRGREFMFLGSGDLAFPLLFCVSVMPLGFAKALACAVGGFAGVITSFLIFNLQKKRRALPALPPITLLSILGFLVGYLFF